MVFLLQINFSFFPRESAGQLQSKIWKTVQLAKYRIRELSQLPVSSTSQAQHQPKPAPKTSTVPSYPAQRVTNNSINTNTYNNANNNNVPANNQPLAFLPGLFQTISQISQGQLTDDKMTRDEVIELNRQTAKNMLQNVNNGNCYQVYER